MSESAITDSGENDPRHESRDGRGLFGRVALFVRQVVSELRRVVTPTLEELRRYTIVVLLFVAVMMAIVFAMDLSFTKVAEIVFGG